MTFKDINKLTGKAYRDREFIKRKARTATRKLERKPCEICYSLPVIAHHKDYSKPLDVVFLCIAHHRAWHRVFVAEGQ